MKTENNLANKELFFAQYYIQKILWDKAGIAENPWYNYNWGEIDKLIIELTPLSQITDEDAIECIGKEPFDFYRNDINDGYFGMSASGIFSDNEGYYENERFSADYLRSKGYALPFLDLSVEDMVGYGWIKLKD